MDEKAIRTCFEYQKLVEQDTSGGYYSEDVRRKSEIVNSLDVESKLEVYKSAFGQAYKMARELCDHSLSGDSLRGWRFDLTPQNLGVVRINYGSYDTHGIREDGFDGDGLKVVSVNIESFNPGSLEESGSSHYWSSLSMYEPKAFEDGSSSDTDIDQQILDVLDTLESLQVVKDHM